jgi:hypothetical protein
MGLIKNSLVHRRVGRVGSSSTASMPYVKGIVTLDFHLSLSPTTLILPILVPDFSGGFWDFLGIYNIQHCFICCPLDSNVSEDAGIEPRTVVTLALSVTTRARFDPQLI